MPCTNASSHTGGPAYVFTIAIVFCLLWVSLLVKATQAQENRLSPNATTIWHQVVSGIPGNAEVDDQLGRSLVWGDFNGDGQADLAVGVPLEDMGETQDAGAVQIFYATDELRLSGQGAQIWSQRSSGVPGGPEANDRFGTSLAAGDFNMDGTTDLVIGIPNESRGGTREAGAVNVLYGSSQGLKANQAQIFDEGRVPGRSPGAQNHFGKTLISGDVNGDGRDDLVIGAPGVPLQGEPDVGYVALIYGQENRARLQSTPAIYHQGTHDLADNFAIEGAIEGREHFGAALAVGDLNGDGASDLAVGVPGESVSGSGQAGAVQVINGGPAGGFTRNDQLWDQSRGKLSGSPDVSETLGGALAAGDFDRNDADDLAIAVPTDNAPGAEIGDKTGLGVGGVHVLYGEQGLPLAAGNRAQWWESHRAGWTTDSPVSGLRFGRALAARGLGLAVGISGYEAGGQVRSGAAALIWSAALAGLGPARAGNRDADEAASKGALADELENQIAGDRSEKLAELLERAATANFQGVWETNRGTLRLHQFGGYAVGDFADRGVVLGKIKGNRLLGTFTAGADVGVFALELAGDGQFKGLWGMHGRELDQRWIGTRTAAKVVELHNFTRDGSSIRLRENERQVYDGVYESQHGTMKLLARDMLVIGDYAQKGIVAGAWNGNRFEGLFTNQGRVGWFPVGVLFQDRGLPLRILGMDWKWPDGR